MPKYEVGNVVKIPSLGINAAKVVRIVEIATLKSGPDVYEVRDWFGVTRPEDDLFNVEAGMITGHYLGAL